MHEFFVGLHHPADAAHVQPSFISINALRNRRSGFPAGRWVLDSGAFLGARKVRPAPYDCPRVCGSDLLLEAVRRVLGSGRTGHDVRARDAQTDRPDGEGPPANHN